MSFPSVNRARPLVVPRTPQITLKEGMTAIISLHEFTDEQKQEILRRKREISKHFEQTTHLPDSKRNLIFHKYARARHPDKHKRVPFHAEVMKFISNEGYTYRCEFLFSVNKPFRGNRAGP